MLINLTPHAITVIAGDSTVTIPPSGKVARVAVTQSPAGEVVVEGATVPVVTTQFVELEGLPEPAEDTLYVVSTLVAEAAAAAGRTDVVAPDAGNAVRDADGKIVGVRGFHRPAPRVAPAELAKKHTGAVGVPDPLGVGIEVVRLAGRKVDVLGSVGYDGLIVAVDGEIVGYGR